MSLGPALSDFAPPDLGQRTDRRRSRRHRRDRDRGVHDRGVTRGRRRGRVERHRRELVERWRKCRHRWLAERRGRQDRWRRRGGESAPAARRPARAAAAAVLRAPSSVRGSKTQRCRPTPCTSLRTTTTIRRRDWSSTRRPSTPATAVARVPAADGVRAAPGLGARGADVLVPGLPAHGRRHRRCRGQHAQRLLRGDVFHRPAGQGRGDHRGGLRAGREHQRHALRLERHDQSTRLPDRRHRLGPRCRPTCGTASRASSTARRATSRCTPTAPR